MFCIEIHGVLSCITLLGNRAIFKSIISSPDSGEVVEAQSAFKCILLHWELMMVQCNFLGSSVISANTLSSLEGQRLAF